MEKYYNEKGQVGVIYSPGFGAGWSTWSDDDYREYLTMNKTLVELVLAEDFEGIEREITQHFGEDMYIYCATSPLRVGWVDSGDLFKITEYDGNETLNISSDSDFMVA